MIAKACQAAKQIISQFPFLPPISYKQVQTFEQELMSVNIERDCLTSEMNKLANKPNRQQRGRLRKAEIEASLEHLDQRAATLRSKIKRSPGPRDPNQRS